MLAVAAVDQLNVIPRVSQVGRRRIYWLCGRASSRRIHALGKVVAR
jgi:hypothetical protein